jgi:hypothetical protein
MADITKAGTPTISSTLPDGADKITGLLAGEALGAGDACYIKGSDGLVYRSTGAAVAAAAKVRGFAARPAVVGDPVTLITRSNWRYGTGLTPGTDVYLSGATVGGLADAASTGGTAPIGFVVDATRIHLFRSSY